MNVDDILNEAMESIARGRVIRQRLIEARAVVVAKIEEIDAMLTDLPGNRDKVLRTDSGHSHGEEA